MSNGQSWTDEQKTGALNIYLDQGAAAASRLTGIPSGTIASWASRTPGMQRAHSERTAAATAASSEAASLLWAETRAELVAGLAGFATAALAAAHDALEDGNVRNAKEAMLAVAIAADKAQLLSGGATARGEQNVTVEERQKMLARGRSRVMELVPPLTQTG